MKKITSILLVSLLILTGCSVSKETTTICSYVEDGYEYAETVVAKNDRILTSSSKVQTDLSSELEANDVTEAELIEYLDQDVADYNAIKGIEYSYTIENNILIDSFVFDFTKANLAQLIELGIMSGSTSDTPDFVSLKQTLQAYTEAGIACQTNE